MPLCALLAEPRGAWAQNFFNFEHAMAHRVNLLVMSPLDRYSVIPYFYEPVQNAGKWHLNHQQAHDDRLNITPSTYGSKPPPGGDEKRINVVDTNLDNPEKRTWWTFVNHHNHYTTEGAILPIPNTALLIQHPPPAPPSPWWTGVHYQLPVW